MPSSLIDVLAEIDPRRSAPAVFPEVVSRKVLPPEVLSSVVLSSEVGSPNADVPPQGRAGPRPETARAVSPAFAPRGPSPEEIEARIADAAAQAASAAREEVETRWAQALETERAEALATREAVLADARAAWAREEGERLAEGVREGLATIEERIAEAAARALAPLLEAAARDKALAALASSVATLLRAEPALVLVARGPADLGEALLARLGDAASAVRFDPAETPDIVVEGEDVVIETRLSEWARRVAAEAA
ncbi:hypothetical protein [Salinarimonas chemoclinalis]|uniref:hypothetical protein n=1 Tax=Salinarimonas chemoclinalis TaxID=3241599 RepID=UPI0035576539